MYKEVLRSIAGVDVFPVISLCLFLLVFGTVLVWTLRLDRERISTCARLPLDAEAGERPGQSRHQGAAR
jgi:hypothetical protein